MAHLSAALGAKQEVVVITHAMQSAPRLSTSLRMPAVLVCSSSPTTVGSTT